MPAGLGSEAECSRPGGGSQVSAIEYAFVPVKHVIKQHRPLRRAMIIAGFIGASVLSVWVAMDYGQWRSIASMMDSTGKKRTLLEEARALQKENRKLQTEATQLRRKAEIDAEARKDNHAEMVRLQSDIADLRKEVAFYRDIFGATSVDVGPQVKGLQLKSLDGDGRFGYKLVMTHVNKDDRMAEGRLSVTISGERGGARKVLKFAEVVESGPDDLKFKFKHFHLFEGTLRMPQGFTPRQLQVTVTEQARRGSRFTKTYDWASVLD